MARNLISRIDPLVRLLTVAIALAILLPARGRAHEVAQSISDLAIFLLFLLNGLRLPREQVLRGIGNVRVLGPLVLWVFGAMTLAGWGASLALAALLPPAVALGFLYLGVLPSTVQSATAYSSIAGGNVAISVVAAALLNVLGVFVAAPIFTLLAGGAGAGISAAVIGKVFLVLLLPFIIGQFSQRWVRGWVVEHKTLVSWMDRSSIAIAVYVAFSGVADQDVWHQVTPLAWFVMVAMACVLLAFAFGGSWLLGGVLRLDRADRISTMFAGAQKSIAMGAPLATVLFPAATAGLILLPVLVYHMLQLILSAPLAMRLSRE